MEYTLFRGLMEAKKAGKISEDRDLAELMELERKHKVREGVHMGLGFTVMPGISYALLQRLKDPPRQRRYFYSIGFLYFLVFWPQRPEAFRVSLRTLVPKYRNVLLEGKSDVETRQLERFMRLLQPHTNREPASSPLPPPPPKLSDPVIDRFEVPFSTPEVSTSYPPATSSEPSWTVPADKAETRHFSPYLSPGNSDKPYVYGSLSNTDRSDRHNSSQ